MQTIENRLSAVRALMAAAEVDAFIVPRSDEYLGEYVPEYNERLLWMTGFTGSAGMAIVLKDRAAIFVDGRYTVQVRQQVIESQFAYHHLIEEPPIEWLVKQLPAGAKVGYDPRLHNLNWQQKSETLLGKHDMALASMANPIDASWQGRPVPEIHQALLLEQTYTGVSSEEKRKAIGAKVAEAGCDAALIFAPDSVAWLLNIRGRDIPSLPLVLGYALITTDGSLSFITNLDKIPEGFADHVGPGVTVVSEAQAESVLAETQGKKILADPNTANAWSQLTMKTAGAELVAGADPVLMPKACKNSTEIQGMKNAHIRDGVAEVNFLAWLDREVAADRLHNEAELSDQLLAFRQEQDLFQEVSFDTISAAGSNAAMCHYNHMNADEPAELQMDGVYLVDSGGQYLDGTTDITRTVAIGEAGDEIRRMFTLVLKGHIALDQARFPEGTTGTHLDGFARQFLWQQGYDFDHGTGHGVGCYLSVHEGPQRIAKALNATPLKPGMVLSNEPGYYKDGAYGIRCENLVVVKEAEGLPGNDKTMLEFEHITLAPFDLRLVDESLMTADEIEWLNAYHVEVRETLSPYLSDENQQWLEAATRAI